MTLYHLGMARTHGKVATYNAGCRCQPCADANAAKSRRYRGPTEPRPLPPHGTPARYKRGCTCGECKAAWSAYCKPYSEAYRRRRLGMKPRPQKAPVRPL